MSLPAAPNRKRAIESAIGIVLLLVCVAIWGVNAVAFKVGVSAIESTGKPAFDAFLFNGIRFLVVAPFLFCLVAWREPSALRAPKTDLLRYAIYGFVAIAVGESVMTAAVKYTSVANMALLGPGTISLCTALWAVFLRENNLSRIGWIGAFVALVGVATVAASGPAGFRIDPESAKGDAMALGRSLIHSLYLLHLAKTLRERPVLTVTLYNIVFGAAWFLPYVLWKAPSVPWASLPKEVWWALLWTIFPTTLFGYVAWNWTMRRVGAVAATNVMYLLPLTSAVSAWALLSQPLHAGQILGGAIIIGGIVLLRLDALRAARQALAEDNG